MAAKECLKFSRPCPAGVHRCGAARARGVPGRVPRPDPRGLHPGSAPVHLLVPRPLRGAPFRSPRGHRDLRPRTRSPAVGPAPLLPGGYPQSPGSTGTPSKRSSSTTRRPRTSAVPGWTTSRTPPPGPQRGRRAASGRRARPAAGHALISLLALNGLLVSEATGADIEHLGLERGHRTLIITRKGGKVVTIPLAPRTARAIVAVGERTNGPLFLAANGRRLDRHGAARVVRRVTRCAGISKKVSPHTLRHAFITTALDAGVPLRDVQEAASHADPRTTRRYDRARTSLDRHATYIVATYIAGAAR
jgi:hypothetical protein